MSVDAGKTLDTVQLVLVVAAAAGVGYVGFKAFNYFSALSDKVAPENIRSSLEEFANRPAVLPLNKIAYEIGVTVHDFFYPDNVTNAARDIRAIDNAIIVDQENQDLFDQNLLEQNIYNTYYGNTGA